MKHSVFQVTIDQSDFLPAECAGGVEMTAQGGRIKVSSTLESRLELIASQVRVVIGVEHGNKDFLIACSVNEER